jgi:transposase
MSVQAPLGYVIPDKTIRVAQAAFPKGTLVMQICDAIGPLFRNTQFTALFSPTGQPAEDPARLALVLIFQFVDWKYALALELTDPGFDASVLSEFRDRLIAGQAELLLKSLLAQ